MAKVSVLVPVYNVSAYIERCARSLFEQTFDDIEYIFVNDATPDDSMERLEAVIRQYPEREVRIVSHERNRGLAVARKTALLAASGDYVCCVDSDDYIDRDMVAALYAKAVEEGADIVVADMYFEYSDQTVVSNFVVYQDREQNCKNVLDVKKNSPFLCSKMIRRKFWLDIHVFAPKEIRYCEDVYVTTRLYFFAHKIVKADRTYYHYNCNNAGAITYKRGEAHMKDMLLYWKDTDEFLREHNVQERYADTVAFSKAYMKARLLMEAGTGSMLRRYAPAFHDVEMRGMKDGRLRRGDKVLLTLLHYRLVGAAYLFLCLLRLKNRGK